MKTDTIKSVSISVYQTHCSAFRSNWIFKKKNGFNMVFTLVGYLFSIYLISFVYISSNINLQNKAPLRKSQIWQNKLWGQCEYCLFLLIQFFPKAMHHPGWSCLQYWSLVSVEAATGSGFVTCGLKQPHQITSLLCKYYPMPHALMSLRRRLPCKH